MKKRVGFQSALLVSVGVIVAAFVGALLAWWVDLSGLAALLLSVSVVGFISRLWGFYSLRDVTARMEPERETLSVGQTVNVRYTLKNNKLLPLIWLELCQQEAPRGCLVPEEGFTLRTFSEEEATYTGLKSAYMRRFSFLMGGASLTWETPWKGECRGVYRQTELLLRSGDGFGLTQSVGSAGADSGRTVVVWPKLVPVETWPFLRHVWSGGTGRAGWQEDPTVMKGERAYQPGDPWKRIDWRTAARTDELMVRQFDTVTPLSVLFLLDCASLEDKEDGISLLASLIVALENSGVECGLALPATASAPAVLLDPEDRAVGIHQLLFRLADYDAETAGSRFDDAAIIASAATAGQVWLVSQGAGHITCPELMGKLSECGVRLLCAREEKGISMTKVYTFDTLRKKEVTA